MTRPPPTTHQPVSVAAEKKDVIYLTLPPCLVSFIITIQGFMAYQLFTSQYIAVRLQGRRSIKAGNVNKGGGGGGNSGGQQAAVCVYVCVCGAAA